MAKREFTKIKKLFAILKRAKPVRFPRRKKPLEAPVRQGVYIIYSPSSKTLHVGSTPRARKGIQRRLRNHLATQSSFTIKYLNRDEARLRNGYKFGYIVVRGVRQRALLEAYAIGKLCPAHIGVGRSALTQPKD